MTNVERGVHTERLAEMASGLAHDLNNILMAIVATADMSTDRAAGTAIAAAAAHAAELTWRLRALGRRDVVFNRPVALEDTLLQILAPLRRLLPVNIRLDTHFACPASIVDADPIELQRILINLALNARDAMPHGGSLVIETSLNRERNLVCWKMTDSGSGIPAAAEESVFQRYFTTKPARSGSGIGLHNVHRMVSEMGGTVTVESQPELGTTLVIELPCITATSSR